jgi:hypothetical protein
VSQTGLVHESGHADPPQSLVRKNGGLPSAKRGAGFRGLVVGSLSWRKTSGLTSSRDFMKLRYRIFGQTGLRVFSIALGTGNFGKVGAMVPSVKKRKGVCGLSRSRRQLRGYG